MLLGTLRLEYPAVNNPEGVTLIDTRELDPLGPDLTALEVATLLGVSRRTVVNYCQDGTVPAWRIRGDRGPWRIQQGALINLIESRTST